MPRCSWVMFSSRRRGAAHRSGTDSSARFPDPVNWWKTWGQILLFFSWAPWILFQVFKDTVGNRRVIDELVPCVIMMNSFSSYILFGNISVEIRIFIFRFPVLLRYRLHLLPNKHGAKSFVNILICYSNMESLPSCFCSWVAVGSRHLQ